LCDAPPRLSNHSLFASGGRSALFPANTKRWRLHFPFLICPYSLFRSLTLGKSIWCLFSVSTPCFVCSLINTPPLPFTCQVGWILSSNAQICAEVGSKSWLEDSLGGKPKVSPQAGSGAAWTHRQHFRAFLLFLFFLALRRPLGRDIMFSEESVIRYQSHYLFYYYPSPICPLVTEQKGLTENFVVAFPSFSV